jgi:sodium/hydrogen antiporter
MTLAAWSVLLGALMVTMALVGTLLKRMPLTAAMLYLVVGVLLGPQIGNVLQPDPFTETGALETLAEVALVVSLFAVGLRLGVPLRDQRWWVPLRLASLSMCAMVAMVAAVGVWWLQLPLGVAVVLGAILAPTDPVLASGLPSEPGEHPDRLGFSLAAEGGLNDGTAFPFVMLGLGLLDLHELGTGGWRWWAVDLLWSTLAGLAIGAALGALTGRLVVYLRSRHAEALGMDEFLSLGLVGLSFGLAQFVLASGFLSVFAAGLALRRVREQPRVDTPPLAPASNAAGHSYDTLARHPAYASATLHGSVRTFNEQIEKVAELTLVLVVGAMLWYSAPLPAIAWFVPLVLLVLRPLSAALAIPGGRLQPAQALMIGWFGIRGIGSVFYLLLALRHGVGGASAQMLVSLTLWTVTASIVVHGLSGQPLMRLYARRRDAAHDQP